MQILFSFVTTNWKTTVFFQDLVVYKVPCASVHACELRNLELKTVWLYCTVTNTVLSITCGSLLLFINHTEQHIMMCETESALTLQATLPYTCALLARGALYIPKILEKYSTVVFQFVVTNGNAICACAIKIQAAHEYRGFSTSCNFVQHA